MMKAFNLPKTLRQKSVNYRICESLFIFLMQKHMNKLDSNGNYL